MDIPLCGTWKLKKAIQSNMHSVQNLQKKKKISLKKSKLLSPCGGYRFIQVTNNTPDSIMKTTISSLTRGQNMSKKCKHNVYPVSVLKEKTPVLSDHAKPQAVQRNNIVCSHDSPHIREREQTLKLVLSSSKKKKEDLHILHTNDTNLIRNS